MRILSIFLSVLGSILLLWVAIDHEPLILQIFGRSVQGRVTGREVNFHGAEQQAESGVLTILYEFEVDGKKIASNASVARAVYDTAESGKSVTVQFLPAYPSINFPDGYLGQTYRGVPLLILGAASFVTGLVFMKRCA